MKIDISLKKIAKKLAKSYQSEVAEFFEEFFSAVADDNKGKNYFQYIEDIGGELSATVVDEMDRIVKSYDKKNYSCSREADKMNDLANDEFFDMNVRQAAATVCIHLRYQDKINGECDHWEEIVQSFIDRGFTYTVPEYLEDIYPQFSAKSQKQQGE